MEQEFLYLFSLFNLVERLKTLFKSKWIFGTSKRKRTTIKTSLSTKLLDFLVSI